MPNPSTAYRPGPGLLARFGVVLSLLLLSLAVRAQTYNAVVAQDGTGGFTTVQAAINAAPTGRTTVYTIFIKNGKYREKVTVPANKPFLQFIGESVANTILSWNDANTPAFPGNSSSFIINASDISALNITFENTYGDAPQGLAMYITGDRVAFKNCRFLGGQDTMQLNSQAGNRSYFKDCYIDGVVDFIFGAGRGVFEHCIVYPRTRRDGGSGGYITAANTQPGQPYGFVFRNCLIPENRGVTTYTLGRPWQNDLGSTPTDRSHTKVVWLNTTMGNSIKPVGWQVWDAGTVTSVIQYAEYKSRDFSGNLVNISQRVPWSIQLTDADTALYTRAAVLGSWDPCTVVPNFCGHRAPDLAVSNFWALKGTAATPSSLTWNLSWPIAGVQYQLLRSTTRRGTYTPLYTTTSTVATNINFGTTDPIPAAGTSYFYYVRASKAGLATHVTDTLQISSTPTITTTGALQAFLQGGGQPSAAQSFLVAGENLTAGLLITPPVGFEVSANGTTWFGSTNPLMLTPSSTGGVTSIPIRVRLNATGVGAYAGNITLSSPGAASQLMAVMGTTQATALPQSGPLQWWPMTRSNQDSAAVRSARLVASTPTLRKFQLSNGSATASIPPYSTRYGQAFAPTADGGWTAAVGGPGGNLNRSYYEQFTVSGTAGSPVRLDSVLLSAYVTGSTSNTKLAVVWSRSGFVTDSADVSGGRGPGGTLLSTANGGFTTPIFTTNSNSSPYRLALAGATGVPLQAGQALSFRVYFSCGSTTTTTRFAALKNVVVKGEAGVVSSSRAARAQVLQVYPNPAAEGLTVAHPAATGSAEVGLYSLLGQRVAVVSCAAGSRLTQLRVAALPRGQYLLRYSGPAGQFTTRVSKQ